jgi:ubiquinone biosynthesis protein Coq4
MIQIFYTAQTALAYNVGAVAKGLANNSMTDAQRIALSPRSSEYSARYVPQREENDHKMSPSG